MKNRNAEDTQHEFDDMGHMALSISTAFGQSIDIHPTLSVAAQLWKQAHKKLQLLRRLLWSDQRVPTRSKGCFTIVVAA